MLFSLRLINATIRAHARKSVLRTQEDFATLVQDAEIWEQDAKGPKVYRLPSGNVVKIFRRKHTFSSAALTSYARHFCHNAESLQWLEIPTVEILELFHLQNSKDTGVIYRPLPGKTIRQLVHDGKVNPSLMQSLGQFIAWLHDKGIYFRSLHFGNVVLTDDGRLGLIDIADLKCYSRPLGTGLRIRNFRHLHRLVEDWKTISSQDRQALASGYLENVQLSKRSKTKLIRSVETLGTAA